MENKVNVAVLMSTYNGETYIEEQVQSILNQSGINIMLYIRDDGSTDGTISIIETLMQKYRDKIHLMKGDNIGPARSFLELLFFNIDADYYSFSDQDDVWLPNKIITALHKLNRYSENDCNLYFSALNKVDSHLNSIELVKNNCIPDFKFSLFRSIFPGCTMVFNKRTVEVIRKHKLNKLIMHDQFLYQLVTGVGGNICYDTESKILYRIHDRNVSNFSSSKKKRIKKLYSDFIVNDKSRSESLKEFYLGYSKYLTLEHKDILYESAFYAEYNILKRIHIAVRLNDSWKYIMMCLFAMVLKKF